MEYLDVMVDIETTGLNHDHSAMIQMAAVKFNPENRTIDVDNMFCQSLLIPYGRYWDEGTRQWWSKQNKAIFQGILANMRDPKVVMQEFAEWCGHSQELRLWAKPVQFDYSFIDSYFHHYDIGNPFNFRHTIDLNSFIRALKPSFKIPGTQATPVEGAHHALNDAIHQIDILFNALDGKWSE